MLMSGKEMLPLSPVLWSHWNNSISCVSISTCRSENLAGSFKNSLHIFVRYWHCFIDIISPAIISMGEGGQEKMYRYFKRKEVKWLIWKDANRHSTSKPRSVCQSCTKWLCELYELKLNDITRDMSCWNHQ